MAESLGEAVLDLRTDDKDFDAGVDRAKSKADELGSKFESVGASLTSLGTTMTAAVTAPIVGLGALSAALADTQIQAEAKLGAALSFVGGNAEAALEDFKAFASGLQAVTTVGDETSLQMLQVATTMGLTGENAKLAVKEAIGLSKAFGIAETTAIRYSAALAQGDTTMLNRYIPTLRSVEDDTERVAKAHQLLGDAFGVATAEAEAGLGPLRQLKNEMGDLLESVGRIVIDAIQPFIDHLRDMVAWLQQLSPEVKATIVTVAGFAAAIGPALLALGGIVTVIGKLIPLVASLAGPLRIVVGLFSGPVGWVAAAAALLLTIKPLREFLVDLGGRVLASLRGWLSGIISDFREWWASTEETRVFLANLARVILDDVVAGIAVLVDWVGRYIQLQAQFVVWLAQGTAKLAEWSGFIDASRLAIDLIVLSVQLWWQWLQTLIAGVVSLVEKLGGMERVLMVVAPGLALVVGKFKEWIAQAKAATGATQSFSAEAVSGGLSIGAMDAATVSLAENVGVLAESAVAATASATELDGAVANVAETSKKAIDGFSEWPIVGDDIDDLGDAIGDMPPAIEGVTDATGDVTSGAGEMADSFGDAVAGMVVESEDLGESIKQIFVGQAKQALTDWIKSFTASFAKAVLTAKQGGSQIGSSVKGWGALLSGGAKGFSSAFQAAAAVAETSVKSALKAIIEFMNSTWIGLVLTIIALAVAAFVVFTKLFGKGADDVHNEVKDLGVKLSEELMKMIRIAEKAIGDAAASIRQHLDDVIREATKNIEDLAKFTEQLALILSRDLAEGIIDSEMAVSSMSDAIGALIEKFDEAGGGIEEFQAIIAVLTDDVIAAFEAGLLSAAEAADIIGSHFDELLDLALKLGDDGVAAIADLVDAVNAAGLSVEEIAAKLRSTLDEALKVLADRAKFMIEQAKGMVQAVEDLFAAGRVGPRQLEFAATAVLQSFDAMLEAGVPLSQILFELQDALVLIGDRASELGAELPAEFQRFAEMLEILATDKIQGLIGKLDALGAAASAAGNLGLLTAQQFDVFGDSTRRAFKKLVAEGLTGEEALAALAPQLQQLHDLSEQYGFAVDKNTQALIDQAMAQGLVTEKGLTTEDILIKGFDNMLIALNALIEALGGVPIAFDSIGEAAQDAADSATQAADDAASTVTDSYADASSSSAEAMQEATDNIAEDFADMATVGNLAMTALEAGAIDTAAAMAEAFNGIPVTFDVGTIHLPMGPGGGPQVPISAQHGTGGFLDFGGGSPAVLHGTEQVITAAEGTGIAQMVAHAIAAAGRDQGNGELIEAVREQTELALLAHTQRERQLRATDGVKSSLRKDRSKPFQQRTPGTVC